MPSLPVMDPLTMMVMLSIGNVVGWTAAMYVPRALPGLIGHVVIASIGAFAGGYSALALFPAHAGVSVIPTAFAGAVLLLYVLRLRKLRTKH